VSISRDSWVRKTAEIKERLVEFLQCTDTALEWKNAIFVFPCLPGSAEAHVIWRGTVKRLLIAYFIGNISAKNISKCVHVCQSYSKSNAGRFLRHGVFIITSTHLTQHRRNNTNAYHTNTSVAVVAAWCRINIIQPCSIVSDRQITGKLTDVLYRAPIRNCSCWHHWQLNDDDGEHVSESSPLVDLQSTHDPPVTSCHRRGAVARLSRGPRLWKTVPDNVTIASSLSDFRRKHKTQLFRQSYPDIVC